MTTEEKLIKNRLGLLELRSVVNSGHQKIHAASRFS